MSHSHHLVPIRSVAAAAGFTDRFTYFAENLAPGGVLVAPPTTAKTAFLTQFSAYSTETFESFALDASNPTLTFAGTQTCTVTGDVLIKTAASAGRFNTTPAGSNYARFTEAKFVFSPVVYAVGFYLTDLGDFYSSAYAEVTLGDGTDLAFAIPNTIAATNSSLIFWGLVVGDHGGIASIKLLNTSKIPAAVADIYGLDDFVVAYSANLTMSGASYPAASAVTDTNKELVYGSHLTAAVSNNTFPNVGSYHSVTAVDSVANSVSSGTLVSGGKFSNGYKSVSGNYITLTFAGVTATIFNSECTLDFFVKRQGASTGTGEIFYWGNAVSIQITGANLLSITVKQYNAATSTNYSDTITSLAALPLDTQAHVRFTRTTIPDSSTGGLFYNLALHIDGVLQSSVAYNDITTAGDPFATFGQVAASAANTMRIGALDASNYGNATISDLRLRKCLACNPTSNFTAPSVEFITTVTA